MPEQRNKSLLVCLTPLQMLIASKIVEQNPGSYDLLCLSYNENEKYDYYFNKLAGECDFSWRFVVKSKTKLIRILDFIRFKFVLMKLDGRSYENIYLASIDNPFFHMLLSKVEKNKIFTFDDGTANIYKGSNYYNYKVKSGFQEGFLKILGNSYNTEKVIRESSKHYSIYRNHSNIIESVDYISIFSLPVVVDHSKRVRVFLGQPLNDLKEGVDKKIVNYVKKIGVDYYFPHPREVVVYDDFNYIETFLIFEDYILSLLRDGFYVEVYTVLSSAALNVSSLENVKIIVLREKELGDDYSDFYNLFESIECDVINF